MLTIVIPALDEEQSIVSICERCLAAAPEILEKTGEEIEIIVVNDGSTDRTAELAAGVDGVRVLSFPKNRGYGAAILAGFEAGSGELVGFLDADGTCDPIFFIPMIERVHAGASVALGNRLGESSEMPKIRRIGNRFFAALIRTLSGARVVDSASGMRVLDRKSLELMLPLPEGLHFTPAMSCRAALDPRLSLAEVPMTYAEREGRSKLGVVRDGIRFLKVILATAITWRPLLLFGAAGALMLVIALLYAVPLAAQFAREGTLAFDRVYRTLTILVLVGGGTVFVYAGALADRAQALVHPPRQQSALGRFVRTVLFARPFSLAAVCFVIAVATNAKALWQYLRFGEIEVHWSTIAFGALLTLAALQLVAFGLVQGVLKLLAQRLRPIGDSRRVADADTKSSDTQESVGT